MPVALHVAADDRAVEDVEGGEQGGGAVALVVVGHGAGAPLLHRQARLGAVERLDLALSRRPTARRRGPADRHRGRRYRAAWRQRRGSLDSLNWRTRCGLRPCARQMRCTELTLMPTALAMAAAVQWVVSPGGSASGRRDHAARHGLGPSGGMRDGRVLSRNRPSTPSCMKRSCQRQTTSSLLPVCRMISAVPKPSAVSRTIRARQTCFCGLFRSATIAPPLYLILFSFPTPPRPGGAEKGGFLGAGEQEGGAVGVGRGPTTRRGPTPAGDPDRGRGRSSPPKLA